MGINTKTQFDDPEPLESQSSWTKSSRLVVAALVLLFIALAFALSPLNGSPSTQGEEGFLLRAKAETLGNSVDESHLPVWKQSGFVLPPLDLTHPPCAVAASSKDLVAANRAMNIVDFARIVKRDTDAFVTVTFASYSYRDTLVNWLLTSERAAIRSVLIVCLDDQLQQFLFDRGIPCFHAYDTQAITLADDTDPITDDYNANADTDSDNAATTSDHSDGEHKLDKEQIHQLWVMRVHYLSSLLHSGIDVLFSDLDAAILQDPRPLFDQADIVASRGRFPHSVGGKWGSTICMGFAYFKATENVKKVVENMMQITKAHQDDQVAVNLALKNHLGSNPEHVWGRRIGLSEPLHAISRIPGKAKVIILSHYALPRFCSYLRPRDWNADILAAHCRLSHAQRVALPAKDRELNRDIAMERWDVFCDTEALKGKRASSYEVFLRDGVERMKFHDPNPEVMFIAAEAPSGHEEFATWLRTNARTCDYASFLNKAGIRDFFTEENV
mmetsp:Transcript_2133/g.4901  ORF Transcript_2133/g.4901 Transcript_2133/m.4901 type:complete len:500 (+) Transcript_2133:457-1956(+)|eukprot:CAMPEP_0171497228 /NCGR_PEP_ID=MMETSP0958-20121227/7147_1 /TAXON_ID=87120 /ORGANISM="Aurantiochytrium limacinum, Strain ATCCMYA-1381" /LENGTH=499 /DNA_ID=CAMNT_0012031431 /DNA_START=341 /DNA_END=1843 /DNA_ORIENTATION=-